MHKYILALIIELLWPLAWAEASKTNTNLSLQPAVEKSDETLNIRNVFLTPAVEEKVLQILDNNSDIKVLKLSNVMGGEYLVAKKIGFFVGHRKISVEIEGVCISACAFIALEGRTLALIDKSDEPPAMILIHGTFKKQTAEWSSVALVHELDFLVERLKVISKADIEDALKFKNPKSGLIITSRPSTKLNAADSLVLTCNPFPSCKSLNINNLEPMRITSIKHDKQ